MIKKSIAILIAIVVVCILGYSIAMMLSSNDSIKTDRDENTNTSENLDTENELDENTDEDINSEEGNEDMENQEQESDLETSDNKDVSNNSNTDEVNSNVTNKNTRVKITVADKVMYANLIDCQASKDFAAMLPLTLTVSDYNNTEKIADLPSELTYSDSPSGYTPQVGDLAYYAPWGNLAIFYKEFRYSNSLIKLGTFESGVDELATIAGDFTATFELVK